MDLVEKMEIEYDFTNIQGIGEYIKDKLVSAGITSIKQLVALTPEQLSKVNGFGLATSKKIIENAQEFSKHNDVSINEAILEENPDKSQGTPILENISEIKGEQVTSDHLSFLREEEPLEGSFQELVESQVQDFKDEKFLPVENDDYPIFGSSSAKENTYNSAFIPKSDRAVEELEAFIENELLLQKQNEELASEALKPNEVKGSEKVHEEIVSKKDLMQVKKTVVNRFKHLGYAILDKQSNLLRNILKDIDILAYKILEVNKSIGTLVVFPVKISQLRGNLLVSENHITYKPTHAKVEISQKCLVSAQKEVFENITNEGSLFQLIRKKLAKRSLVIRKTKNGTPLFISTHSKEYKPVIHPILVSISEPAFLEKTALFPYQRKFNIHVVESREIISLVQFLEKKISIRESFLLENALVKYNQSLINLKNNLQKYSIPVLMFGVIFLGIMFLQNFYILATFTNLGVAALIIYGIIMGFVYRTFAKTRKNLKNDYKTPYFLKPVELDETDLLSIQDTMSSHELDQILYEWFGKSCEFSFIKEIESIKALETQKDIEGYDFPLQNENISSVSYQNEEKISIRENNTSSGLKENSVRGQMISKYSTFLED